MGMPPVKCDDCSQHSCSPQECNACEDCEYTTKILDGRKTLGCFDSDSGAAKEDKLDGREYLEGNQPVEKQTFIVPHYRFWDPGDSEEAPEGDDVVDESSS